MAFQGAEWYRKRIEEALSLRWKRRYGCGLVMCGPDDQEAIESGIASGAEVYATPEDYVRFDAKNERIYRVIDKTVNEIIGNFTNLTTQDLINEMRRYLLQFQDESRAVAKIESSSRTKKDLQELAESAFDLAIKLLSIGDGAKGILANNRYRLGGTDKNGKPLRGHVSISEWMELKQYGDIWRDDDSGTPSELSFIPHSGLLEDAEINNLPWVIPYEAERYDFDDGFHDYEWSLGGAWIVRLSALAELAATNAEHLGEVTGRGGRKSLGDRLYGSPYDSLAMRCRELAVGHGCHSQSVILKMVQCILYADSGKRAFRRLNGKPATHRGRKAVRKVVQTKRKVGTV